MNMRLVVVGMMAGVAVAGGCVPGLKNGNGPIAKLARERLVARLDVNKDGVVDASELEPVRERMAEMRERVREAMLARFDADKDGKLSAAERERAWEQASAKLEDIHESAVAKFDADKNGELDAAELKAAFEAVKARRGIAELSPGAKDAMERVRSAALERFDADKSGALSAAERGAMRAEVLGVVKERVREASEKIERGERLVSDEQVLAWLNGG